ncbi:MAG: GNAT family N-acetyltransferase [Tabrizicola sp.]|jgi:ribosomal protein S18 acetylase RimI-like enzyme|nr:GNAT family N-acetyltransferase [Tabrizicola sp.]
MTRDWQIRCVGPEAAAAVLAADVFDGPATAEATRRFLGQPGSADPRNILILAERAGRIVGFASGTVLDHPDKPPSLFVQEVGVNDDARRQGIGRALVQALRAEGRKAGCTTSWVLTDADNGPARALYSGAEGVETPGVVMVEWEEGER